MLVGRCVGVLVGRVGRRVGLRVRAPVLRLRLVLFPEARVLRLRLLLYQEDVCTNEEVTTLALFKTS